MATAALADVKLEIKEFQGAPQDSQFCTTSAPREARLPLAGRVRAPSVLLACLEALMSDACARPE